MTVAGVSRAIALRDMTRADLRRVRRIERAAYEDAWPARVFEHELRNGFAHYRVALAPPDASTSGGAWGALRRVLEAPGGSREGAVVGFMGVWYMVDQLHLVTIAVDPPHQRQGIGQRLLLDCFDLCLEAELPSIVLEVRESNERAQRLYESFGFRRRGRVRGYYQDNGEDALVMIADGLDSEEGRHAHRLRWRAFRHRVGERFAD